MMRTEHKGTKTQSFSLWLFFVSLCLCVPLVVHGYDDYRNTHVDSLEAALKSANPPKGEELLKAYDELMRGYLSIDDKKAEYYAQKALALSYEVNGVWRRQNALRHLGLLRYGKEDFDEALRYFQQTLAVVDTMEHDSRYNEGHVDDARSAIYGSIANVYNLQGKAHLAINYYQKALPIFEKHHWLQSQAILYNNIGELYLIMGNNQEAERNYLLAIQKGEESKDSLMMALPQKGLVKLYIGQNDYEKARQKAEQCYAYYYAHRDEEVEDYPVVLSYMARLNLMEGHQDLVAAKAYAREAVNLADSLRLEEQRDVYVACSEVAMTEGRWKEALEYGLRTVRPDSLATDADANCYRLLAEIYTELGQKEKAREYIGKMFDVMTRYATDHYQSGLSQMEVLYETEKKEAQINALDKERGLYFWLLAAAIGLIVLLAVLFVYRHLAHRRQKALLAAKVALETETKERRILARDLHDGLGGMLSLLRMKLETYFGEDRSDEFAIRQQGDTNLKFATHGSRITISAEREVMTLLDAIHTELRRTAHHLMPEELLKNGLVSALRDFAVSVPNAHFQVIGDICLEKDKELVLYRCAYELVNNAMKHAEASKISIQLMQEPHQVTLSVSDDGKGMVGEGKSPITIGTEGMGLQNIRERIEPYKGRLDIVSADGQGTDINITLKIEH